MTSLLAQWTCPFCGYGEYKTDSWAKRVADHIQGCEYNPNRPAPVVTEKDSWLETVARLFHQKIEGEYGCQGSPCPGVDRLIAAFKALEGIGKPEWIESPSQHQDRLQSIAKLAILDLMNGEWKQQVWNFVRAGGQATHIPEDTLVTMRIPSSLMKKAFPPS